MGRKCSIYKCTGGFDSETVRGIKKSVHKFPADSVRRNQWIEAIPRHAWTEGKEITRFMGVCSDHWPEGYEKISVGRWLSPKHPPSLFPTVPVGYHRPGASDAEGQRSTLNSSTTIRSTEMPDELPEFDQEDYFKTSLDSSFDLFMIRLINELTEHSKCLIGNSYEVGSAPDYKTLVVLSEERNGAIHSSSMYLKVHTKDKTFVTIDSETQVKTTIVVPIVHSVSFDGYFGIQSAKVPICPTGIIKRWSCLSEVLHYFRITVSVDPDDPSPPSDPIEAAKVFIERQIQLLNAPRNGVRIYTPNDLIQAFGWYTRSRALYAELRKHLRLPSLTTLARLTRI